MYTKKIFSLAMAAFLSAMAVFPVYAGTEKIDTVRLEFSYDKEPESGDDIGDISVRARDDSYDVDSVEYTNLEDKDVWTVGDVPEVKVELSASEGYRFSYTSKSHFKISGCDAEFKKAKIYDDGDYMEVTVELDHIGGKLEAADNLDWNDSTAEWDEVEGSKSYDVKLLRDDKTVTTVNTSNTYFDFSGYFNKEGDYTFRVRAIASYNDKAGEWSEDSSSLYVDEDEAGSYGGSGRWVQEGGRWWYSYSTGGYPADGWKQIDGVWYLFDRSGYMLTGWQKVDRQWYYLGSNGALTTGWQNVNGQWYYLNGSGEMQTGWQYVSGRWYYLNSSGVMQTGWLEQNGQWYYLDGSGAMTTGWQSVNGRWYYMGGSGVMFRNTWTPDGRYVDGSGAWVQ